MNLGGTGGGVRVQRRYSASRTPHWGGKGAGGNFELISPPDMSLVISKKNTKEGWIGRKVQLKWS